MKKILLVDNTPLGRDELKQVADGDGRILVTGGGASWAIQKLGEESFNLVITNLSLLPQGDDVGGMEILEFIRDRSLCVPVIVVTTYASINRHREVMANGAYDFLDRQASGIDHACMLRCKIEQALELQTLRALAISIKD